MQFQTSLILSTLVVFLLLTSSNAWGFEPLKSSSRCTTFLSLRDRETDMDTKVFIESYRFKLENFFDLNYGASCGDFAFMKQRAEELAIETFAESRDFDLCGKDCEDCDIPEDWKTPFSTTDKIDVMDFLGIKRAEPLIAKNSDLKQ